MRIHTLQHVPFEWIGQIEAWAKARHHTITVTRFFESYQLPDPKEIDLLIVMGGPMSVHDEEDFPWLKEEKRFLTRYLNSERNVLGICLGAQLLAQALGAKVYRAPQGEIGWHRVELTQYGKRSGLFALGVNSLTTFHWHNDTFDLPNGARQLARSAACENQAFSFGKHVLGVQFHIEMSGPEVEDICKNCSEDLPAESEFIQSAEAMARDSRIHSASCKQHLEFLLDKLSQEHRY